MSAAQSEALTAFYDAYLHYAETGENPHCFLSFCGLCDALTHMPGYAVTFFEMKKQFRDAGLNEAYPFNAGSPDLYSQDESKSSNSKRLAWVRAHSTEGLRREKMMAEHNAVRSHDA